MFFFDHKLTQDQTKAHNQRLVLKAVYWAGPCSRADLARATGLTRTTTSAVADELLAAGLVMEIGQGPSAGGKPPTLLKFVDDARVVIGVDLTAERLLQGGVFDLRGRRLSHVSAPGAGGLAASDVIHLIDLLMATTAQPLLGIGVGLPGLIDLQEGLVRQAVPAGWQELPLGQALRQHYVTPVALANDSQAAALAQYLFGAAMPSSLAFIRAGNGISAGLLLNGRVYQGGSYAGASEIGHVRAVEDGERCVCGRFGCLETVATERALLRAARQTLAGHDAGESGALDFASLAQAYHRGDPVVRQVVDRSACYLGAAAAHLVAALNLPLVVLTGSLTRLGPDFVAAVQSEMQQRMLPPLAVLSQVRLSTLGDDDVMLGAAALVLANELGVV